MKNLIVLFSVIFLMIAPVVIQAQVAISNDSSSPNPSAMLDVKSTDKGVLIPRMSSVQRIAIANPSPGLLVYDLWTESFWFYNFVGWQELRNGNIRALADDDNDTKVIVEEIPDEDAVHFYLAGNQRMTLHPNRLDLSIPLNNLCVGVSTGASITTGVGNSFYGIWSGLYNTTGSYNITNGMATLFSNISGNSNIAMGYYSLYSHIHGDANIGIGNQALFSDTIGHSNVAIGYAAMKSTRDRNNIVALGDSALYSNGLNVVNSQQGSGNTALGSKTLAMNTTGYNNTATGYQSIISNISGINNTANGYQALYSNLGDYNSAFGCQALYSNQGGASNTSIGNGALFSNLGGYRNTAAGKQSMYLNTGGNDNVGLGTYASYSNTTGSFNVVIGYNASWANQTGSENVVIGCEAAYGVNLNSFSHNTLLGFKAGRGISTGSYNILIGHNAGDNLTTGSNNIILGYNVDATIAGKNNEMILGDPNLLYGDIANKRIGIGTTSPACQLHIQSDGDAMILLKADDDNVNEDDNPRLEMRQDGAAVVSGLGMCGYDNSVYNNTKANALYLVNEYAAPLQFGTDSVITMTILSNGKVGILNNAPEQALHVTGSAKISSLAVNGPVYSNNGVLTNTNPSDMRLKSNIRGIDHSLERVMRLHPVTFNWKSDGKQGIGFIAQELEEVIPELVATGDDGNKGIYTVEMIPYLVKALQEQQAMIDELQKKVTELEKR